MSGVEKDGQHTILLVYPDSREAALGSPGFREVFRSFESDDRFLCDWAWYDRKNGLVECEDYNRRSRYDCIALSVPYELLFANAVEALIALSIEPERGLREDDAPLIVIGGVVPTLNPSPASVIADMVFTGEAEEKAADAVSRQISKTGAANKLTPMSGVTAPENQLAAPRFYIPAECIDSSLMISFDNPSGSAFSGAGLVEIGRGCSRACRFCAAGHIYLPVRHRSVDAILKDVDSFNGRADRIGLVGSSISDHRELPAILSGILDRGFGLTTSSFRADMLTEELVELLVRGGLKTLTIAPEGGSERMRNIMNKNLSEGAILKAAYNAAKGGISTLRLYFIVGMPWENEEDISAITALCDRIAETVKPYNARITVSLNPFIPKAQTPFQWCPMASDKYLETVYRKLKKAFLKRKGISLKMLSIRTAQREAVIGLGGEEVGMAIIENARDSVPWKKALKNNNVDIDRLLYCFKERDARFPWNSPSADKRKAALYASFENARRTAQSL